MKIAIISPGSFSVPPVIGSSVEHDIQMVAEQLEKTQHEVIVYARKCPEYNKSTEVGNLYYKRYRIKNYDHYLSRIQRHLKRWEPDVILVENRPSYILRLKKKFPKTPILLNMHSVVFASLPQISPMEMKEVARQVDGLITNSAYLRNFYIQKFPPFKNKAFSVHLGIDSNPFEEAHEREQKIDSWRKRLRIKPTDRTILFVGRLLKQKGIHLVFDVLPKLIKKYPDIKLVITGSPVYGRDIQTPYVQMLHRKAQRLRKHIVFTHFVSPQKIPYIYQLADIVVIPSIWQEPFGRVNLEAMASTKAIIASDRGGIPELVKHEENGFVISIDRYKKELYDSISKLLDSNELREEFGKRGFEIAKNFSWAQTANEYVKIFDGFLCAEQPVQSQETVMEENQTIC